MTTGDVVADAVEGVMFAAILGTTLGTVIGLATRELDLPRIRALDLRTTVIDGIRVNKVVLDSRFPQLAVEGTVTASHKTWGQRPAAPAWHPRDDGYTPRAL